MSHSHSNRKGSRRGSCQCCIGFIVTLGITALFMWLGFRVFKPICSIEDIYVPALNKTGNSTTNTTLFFDLKLDNPNWDKGIYYDDIHLTFYYVPNQTSSSFLGNMTIQQFYQGNKKKAHRRELVETHGVLWKAISRAVSNRTVVFRVDLETDVRFKIMKWKTKRHKLAVGADVEVNDSGNKINRNGIRLKSDASALSRRGVIIFVLLLFYFH